MHTAFLVALLVGLSAAAVQQARSPVYQGPQVTSTGSSVNSTPLLKNPQPLPTTSSPVHPVAEARESVATDASMLQPQAVGVNPSTPSQNYYVYYYPNQGQTGTVGQPNSSSILSWNGWNDVATGVGCLALVAIGGGILYNRYGTQVKSRAMRELQDMTYDDIARMSRHVLTALEKFSTTNNHTE